MLGAEDEADMNYQSHDSNIPENGITRDQVMINHQPWSFNMQALLMDIEQ